MSSAHSPSFPSLHLRHSSFSNPSLASPASQLILQPFRCFTYVTAHSPTLLSLLLCHKIFTYVTWRAAHDLVYRTPSFFVMMQAVRPLLLSHSCAADNRTRPIRVERLRFLRQSERTTATSPVQHKRWTYPCYRAVNTEHQQRWTSRWCTTASKHLVKGDK